jgi:hypothetical protein
MATTTSRPARPARPAWTPVRRSRSAATVKTTSTTTAIRTFGWSVTATETIDAPIAPASTGIGA